MLANEVILMHETAFSLMVRSKQSPVPTECQCDCILVPLQNLRQQLNHVHKMLILVRFMFAYIFVNLFIK